MILGNVLRKLHLLLRKEVRCSSMVLCEISLSSVRRARKRLRKKEKEEWRGEHARRPSFVSSGRSVGMSLSLKSDGRGMGGRRETLEFSRRNRTCILYMLGQNCITSLALRSIGELSVQRDTQELNRVHV